MIVRELIEQLQAMSPRDEVLVESVKGYSPVVEVTLQRWTGGMNPVLDIYAPDDTQTGKKEWLQDVVVLWGIADE